MRKIIGMLSGEFEPDTYKDSLPRSNHEVIRKAIKGPGRQGKRRNGDHNQRRELCKLKASSEAGKRRHTTARSTGRRP